MNKFIELFTANDRKVWVKKARIYRIEKMPAARAIIVGCNWDGKKLYLRGDQSNLNMCTVKECEIYRNAYMEYSNGIEKLNKKAEEQGKVRSAMYDDFTQKEKEKWLLLSSSLTAEEDCTQIREEFPKVAEYEQVLGEAQKEETAELKRLKVEFETKCDKFLYKARFKVFVHGASYGGDGGPEIYYGAWSTPSCIEKEIAEFIKSL